MIPPLNLLVLCILGESTEVICDALSARHFALYYSRAAWRNAGTASYASALGAKIAPSTLARLSDLLSMRHFALYYVCLNFRTVMHYVADPRVNLRGDG